MEIPDNYPFADSQIKAKLFGANIGICTQQSVVNHGITYWGFIPNEACDFMLSDEQRGLIGLQCGKKQSSYSRPNWCVDLMWNGTTVLTVFAVKSGAAMKEVRYTTLWSFSKGV
jgi:hypothetical protein